MDYNTNTLWKWYHDFYDFVQPHRTIKLTFYIELVILRRIKMMQYFYVLVFVFSILYALIILHDYLKGDILTYFSPMLLCKSNEWLLYEMQHWGEWVNWNHRVRNPKITKCFNPLSPNPTKLSNTLNSLATADELFEYVWPFCGVGA